MVYPIVTAKTVTFKINSISVSDIANAAKLNPYIFKSVIFILNFFK